MFKKPKRNFRARKVQDEDSDGDREEDQEEKMEIAGETYIVQETAAEEDPTPIAPAVKKKKKKKAEEEKPVKKSSSVLSFTEEEEAEDVFKIKRSSHSRRVAKQLKKQTQQEKEQERELKAKKKELQRQKQQQNSYGSNGAVRFELGEEEDGAGDDMELGSDFDPDEDLVKPGDELDEEREVDEDAERRRAFQNILESGVIPDAKMIHEARKRRQMARELGDFVPLDDTVKVEKSASRLVREDDNDKSDSDDEPVAFSLNRRETELRNMQNTILAAQEESDNDQEKEWEEQQIRKGTSMPQVQEAPAGQQQFEHDGYQQQYGFGTGTHSIFQQQAPAPGEEALKAVGVSAALAGTAPLQPTDLGSRRGLHPTSEALPQVTIEQVKKRLKDRLESMVSVHRAHVHERDDLASRHELSETSIEKRSGSQRPLEEQYTFFQQMRGYVRDLVECLNEKVPQINYLERRVLQIEKTRTDYLIKRRQEDIKDQSADLMSNKAAAAPSFSGVDSPSGQKQEQQKQRRVAEREARRTRRRQKRETKNVCVHHEGMSSDDEENNSIIAKYKLEIETIRGSCDTLFEDALDDFHDLNLIKSRFEDWRSKHNESYTEAYIGLCLPKLFTPLVKLSLVTWNPLQDHAGRLDDSKWFESLMFYAFRVGDDNVTSADHDVTLVPTLIEKVIISKLTQLVEQVWDPLSGQQTRRLVTLIQGLVCDYPSVSADSKHVQELVRAVVTRVKKTLDDDVFMPLYAQDVLANRASGQYRFFQRQFWTCVKLLGNILSWHGILSDRVLRELALDGLLNRYVMLGLINSPPGMETVQKCRAICAAFPAAWFSDLQDMSTIPQLENLCKCMVNMANRLEQAKTEQNRKDIKDTVKQIMKLLVNVHALDHAQSLSKS